MGKRKTYTGTVMSDKMQKTRVVRVLRMAKHPKYGKMIKHPNKFKVHDEKNLSKVGDVVLIEETRPLSKEKRFRLVKILKKAALLHVDLKEIE